MDEIASSRHSWRNKAAVILPHLAAIAAAVLIWFFFSPGIMSSDSLDQYRQALVGKFHNWHPPIMSIVLWAVMARGGDIGALMLMQCIAGVLGIRALAAMVLEQLSEGRWTPSRIRWLATLTAVLMLLPITPTAFYMMTFWKDSWTAISFLWGGASGLWLYRRCERMSSPTFWTVFAFLSACMIMAAITRHNAIATMPIAGCMSWMILARRGIRFSWLMIGFPVVASVLTSMAIDHIFHVEARPQQTYVKMMDLVSICVAYPDNRGEFPYVAKHLCEGAEREFRYGDLLALVDPKAPVVDNDFYFKPSIADIDAEYRHAIFKYPSKLLYVKWAAFCQLFDTEVISADYCHKGIDANTLGLRPNLDFQMFRYDMYCVFETTRQKPLLNMLTNQNVWFSLDFLACLGLLIHLYRRRTGLTAFWLIVLFIPLSYSCSYLVATTGVDYRFLYPSTLFVQAVALAAAIYFVTQYFKNNLGMAK
jgi:hypothetical protein